MADDADSVLRGLSFTYEQRHRNDQKFLLCSQESDLQFQYRQKKEEEKEEKPKMWINL